MENLQESYIFEMLEDVDSSSSPRKNQQEREDGLITLMIAADGENSAIDAAKELDGEEQTMHGNEEDYSYIKEELIPQRGDDLTLMLAAEGESFEVDAPNDGLMHENITIQTGVTDNIDEEFKGEAVYDKIFTGSLNEGRPIPTIIQVHGNEQNDHLYIVEVPANKNQLLVADNELCGNETNDHLCVMEVPDNSNQVLVSDREVQGNEPNDQLFVVEVPADNNQLLGADIDELEGIDIANEVDRLPEQQLTRKKIRKPENWKRNVRKKKCQAGEEYVNAKGKVVKEKTLVVKKDCLNHCKIKCSKKITNEERQSFFSGFYNTQSHNEKTIFLVNNTERRLTTRKTKEDNDKEPSRRKYSFKYFFTVKGTKTQVCKSFFLSTLQISQKRIYNAHIKKDPTTGYPKLDKRGSAKGRGIPEYAKNDVRNHIKSFPLVESHYCRSDTKKQYLESSLNLAKMFSLFKEKHPNHVIKKSMYRHIFNSEFNCDFHVFKKDRCDFGEEIKVALQEKIPFDEEKFSSHISAKNAVREERRNDMDRKQNDVPVLSFDLENVITCPQAEVSSMFYYSKLNVYNLTAHLQTQTKKSVYCAIWPETMAGRARNDLASAVYKIMTKVLEKHPLFDKIITWSDSCVPKNKNQMMSGAMLLVLKENPQLKNITMKYSSAGHGAVQVVDNIHSQIEKAMAASEFYSPLGLLRHLKKVSPKNPYNLIQMSTKDFLNFADSSKELNFNVVPFTKVCSLTFTQTFGEIQYKEIHSGATHTVNLKPAHHPGSDRKTRKKTPKRTSQELFGYKSPKIICNLQKLNPKKIRDLNLMRRFMPSVDRDYYDAILKN